MRSRLACLGWRSALEWYSRYDTGRMGEGNPTSLSRALEHQSITEGFRCDGDKRCAAEALAFICSGRYRK